MTEAACSEWLLLGWQFLLVFSVLFSTRKSFVYGKQVLIEKPVCLIEVFCINVDNLFSQRQIECLYLLE